MFNIEEDENLTRNRQVGQQVSNRHLPGLYIPTRGQLTGIARLTYMMTK